MPQKATILLENNTKFSWTKTHQSQRQMNKWSFPESVAVGETASVEVEFSWGSSFLCCFNGHEASVSYRIGEDPKTNFSLHAEYTNISVVLRGLGNLDDQDIDLGWSNKGKIPFTISSSGADLEDFIASGAPAPDWMEDNLQYLGSKALKEICLPGSHNSGMSFTHHETMFGSLENSQTQTMHIRQQLEAGIRHFDIRPIATRHDMFTGHYSNTGVPGLGWQGALGQSIVEIVDDINKFTKTYKSEVIILRVSHAYNKDAGFSEFSESDWTTLFTHFDKLKSKYIHSKDGVLRLSDQKISELAGVSIIIPDGIKLGERTHQGYYHEREFPVLRDYANTNDLERMKEDQKQKMDDHAAEGKLFHLLWFTTKSAWNSITRFPTTIESAEKANQDLDEVIPGISAQILSIDDASSHLTAKLLPYNLFGADQSVEMLGDEESYDV